MESIDKLLIYGIVAGGIVGGAVYLSRLSQTSAELEIVPSLKIHRVGIKGIVLRVDVQMKNPTRTALEIKFPFVKLLFRGSTLGSSQAVDQDIKISAFGEAMIEAIYITIPITGVFSLANSFFKALGSGEKVELHIKTITVINLGWKTINYSKTDIVILKNETPQEHGSQA